ncbi:hypothetical protein VKT23_012527 [Stygiomarasmius scandens]|uniref:Uncharacterized protein n=1 Tax=Marasmiellus scandens TaxID=2682957 RepID=A0ABR1J9F9_9AGAR
MSTTSGMTFRHTPAGDLNEMEKGKGKEREKNPDNVIAFGINPSTSALASGSASTSGGDQEASPVIVSDQPYVKVTLWRLINTAVPTIFGLWKVIGTYRGQTTAPTTLDLVISVFWYIFSYWMGIWETTHSGSSSTAWLFDVDIYKNGLLNLIYFFVLLLLNICVYIICSISWIFALKKDEATILDIVKLLLEVLVMLCLMPLAMILLHRMEPFCIPPRRQRFPNLPRGFEINYDHSFCCMMSAVLLSFLATIGLIWSISKAVQPSGRSECFVIDNDSAQNTTSAAIQVNQSVPENENMCSMKKQTELAGVLAIFWLPLSFHLSLFIAWVLQSLIFLGYDKLQRKNLNKFVDLVLNALDNAWQHFLDLIEDPDDLNRAMAQEMNEEEVQLLKVLHECSFL